MFHILQKCYLPVLDISQIFTYAIRREFKINVNDVMLRILNMHSCFRRILTETETELISQKRFNELVEQQKKLDAEIDAQLSRQEDDLRLEEEVILILSILYSTTYSTVSYHLSFHFLKGRNLV